MNTKTMDIKIEDYVKQQRSLIDKAIENFLQEQYRQFREKNMDTRTLEAVTYGIENGKRYRGMLLLESGKLCGASNEYFLKTSVGLELIHSASLITDDLPCMDDALIRKGRLTVHRRFGESTAQLAIIRSWNLGLQIIFQDLYEKQLAGDITTESLIAANNTLYDFINKLTTGQELDLKKEKTREEVMRCSYLKNSLFHTALVLPAIALNKRNIKPCLDRIGKKLSIAYQLFDDLRDIEGKTEITGKEIGKDVDKTTSIKAFGLDIVKQIIDTMLDEIKRETSIIKQKTKQKTKQDVRLEELIEYMLKTAS